MFKRIKLIKWLRGKRKEPESTIALPPDFNFAKKVIEKRHEEHIEREEKTFKTFQIWLSKFTRKEIERSIKTAITWFSFSIEMSKDRYGTEYGSIFRMFYEQGNTRELSFSQDLLDRMKDWILKDFATMYKLAGYEVSISEKRFEISWRRK